MSVNKRSPLEEPETSVAEISEYSYEVTKGTHLIMRERQPSCPSLSLDINVLSFHRAEISSLSRVAWPKTVRGARNGLTGTMHYMISRGGTPK